MMPSNPISVTHDVVLLGGGHSHAIALKLWGMNPLAGVRLTLITDTSHTPYSGMLPGHVAGFYSYDETHLDLRRLAQFSNAQFYLDTAINLDLSNNKVICNNHPPVAFDYLSIDIGSTPKTLNIPGASQYAIPAKPVPQFLEAWQQLVQTVINFPQKHYVISIVGGGAGGVELALNIHSRLTRILEIAHQPLSHLTIYLFHRGETLLSGQNAWVSRKAETILKQKKIQVFLNEEVIQITPNDSNYYQIRCQSNLKVYCNYIFWVTQASAPSWIKNSDLKTDKQGFILVNNYLQSVSHSNIFAAGDIATIQNNPCPKAGVFAVRQGKPLLENLQRIILEKPLKNYQPQKQYLSLIGTGDKSAIASWSFLGWESSILWRWKDYIDRKFMKQFEALPIMTQHPLKINTEMNQIMHCTGCGSKLGSTILDRVLNRLEINQTNDILVGLNRPDDAAIITLNSQQLLVQTIDFFPSLINDPFLFGQITAHHCLNDIFAMGATPHSALAVVSLPYALEKNLEETLYQVLSGVLKTLNQSQVCLIGGHTLESSELAVGLSCNGFIFPEKLLQKKGIQSGNKLILTKPIGSGILLAADRQYQAKGRWIDQAITSMLLSNQEAIKIFLELGATACTDITGFGLVGHLIEMMKASQVSVNLELAKIPLLDGAIPIVQRGITSSLYPQNLQASAYISNLEDIKTLTPFPLLFDPQTSGGLLASIPEDKADECLLKLRESGFKHSNIIGQALGQNSTQPSIRIH